MTKASSGAEGQGRHRLGGPAALSDALRMELREFGISVVMIEPSRVDTALADASAGHSPSRRASKAGGPKPSR